MCLYALGRNQSEENMGDDDQTETKHKKNSQTDLTQKARNQTDLKNATKDTGKSERTSTGMKRKALNRSGKYTNFCYK